MKVLKNKKTDKDCFLNKKSLYLTFFSIGLVLLFVFLYFVLSPIINELNTREIYILKKVIINFFHELIMISIPKFFDFFNLFMSIIIIISWPILQVKKQLEKHLLTKQIVFILLYLISFNIKISLIHFILIVIELFLFYKIIIDIVLKQNHNFLKNIMTITLTDTLDEKVSTNMIRNVYLICIFFIFLLSVDYTIIMNNLNYEQIDILKKLSDNDNFFIINKFINHVIRQSSKSIMYDTIIQMSSVFITFMGFILSFLTGSIYSINIHTIICWECNQFKLFYHRIVTIMIVIISFFVSSTKYTITIVFLDVYLIWIIIYNIYVISSISLYFNFENIVVRRIEEDLTNICKIINESVRIGITNQTTYFYENYMHIYGKYIFLPMNLLIHHMKKNKDEFYQLSTNILSKYFMSREKISYDLLKSICFMIDEWSLAYFEQLKDDKGKVILNERDNHFIFSILTITKDLELENYNKVNISCHQVICGLILANMFIKVKEEIFINKTNNYQKYDNNLFTTHIFPALEITIFFVLYFYGDKYINSIFEFIENSVCKFNLNEMKKNSTKYLLIANDIITYRDLSIDPYNNIMESFFDYLEMK